MAEEEKQSLAEDTLVEVSKDLAELLSNSVNMADKFFEIFFDPNPHLVTLELYDREGTRTTYQIPNRAMDKSVALSGNGSPEGVIEAEVGTLYIDEDKRELYIKRTKDSSMGWLNITPYTLDVYTDEFTYNYEVTGNIKLKRLIEYPEHLQVYADGLLLIPPPEGITYDSTATGHTYDYQISDDKQTLFIYKELPANTTIFVRYLDGMGALKGDTAIKVSVGETTTLNAGENAQVTETIEEESAGQTITLDFAIPRGATGNTGVHIGANPPEDPNQNIWLDTNASGTSTADFASMRIWDSGICNNLSGYNKVYDIKHSYYMQDAVEKYGDVYVTSNGVMTSLTDKGYTKYVKIPYKIGNLKGKNWYISGKCKLKKPQIDETPILLLGERTRLNGAIFARPFGFFFAARTGDVQDNDELHDNSGVKAEILYEFKEDELEEFYYELSFTVDGSLFVFAVYDKDTNLIGKRYWNGPPTIVKNSQLIYMHSTELLNVNVYPNDYIVIGAHIADEDGNVNRHSAEDEYNLRNFTLSVSNEDGVLEPAYSSNLEKSLTLKYPDGTTKNIKYYDCITGAKVADVAYKPIIDDYFNTTGKGNIYLLDEQNKTFELPKPDIYGLIEDLDNKKVNRAGDTMTGRLNINGPVSGQLNIFRTNPAFDTPSESKLAQIVFCGSDNNWAGVIDNNNVTGSVTVDGVTTNYPINYMGLTSRTLNDDGTTYTQSSMGIGTDSRGNKWTYAPHPADKLDNSNKLATTNWVRNHCCITPATTTSTASLDAPCYVIENYVNGTSWYRKYSDKWLEQGGVATYPEYVKNYELTVNLVKPYKTETYFVWSNLRNGGNNWAVITGVNTQTFTTTTFVLYEYQSMTGNDITVASHDRYWFAEGYTS